MRYGVKLCCQTGRACDISSNSRKLLSLYSKSSFKVFCFVCFLRLNVLFLVFCSLRSFASLLSGFCMPIIQIVASSLTSRTLSSQQMLRFPRWDWCLGIFRFKQAVAQGFSFCPSNIFQWMWELASGIEHLVSHAPENVSPQTFHSTRCWWRGCRGSSMCSFLQEPRLD